MNIILQFLIFFSIFFIIYFGMHFYVFRRMSHLLNIKRNVWFYVLMVLMALSFPLASIIERMYASWLSRMVYIASSVWLGTLFLTFCALLIYEILKWIVKLDKRAAGITIIIFIIAIVTYGVLNAMTITVREIEIPIPNLEKELTIVQLSDIHIGTVHEWDYMERIAKKTNELNPDIVMITGDLYDGSRKIDDRIITPLNSIKAETFFVTGNHDLFEGIDEVMSILNRTKVKTLKNEVVEYEGIQIVGVENPTVEMTRSNDEIKNIKLDRNKPSVLMYHQPSGLEEANKAGINLQLSGHTHHGQIMPFTLISRTAYPRNNGLYNYEGTYMYVTEGTGTWGPFMRVGTRNEITVVKLVKK